MVGYTVNFLFHIQHPSRKFVLRCPIRLGMMYDEDRVSSVSYGNIDKKRRVKNTSQESEELEKSFTLFRGI